MMLHRERQDPDRPHSRNSQHFICTQQMAVSNGSRGAPGLDEQGPADTPPSSQPCRVNALALHPTSPAPPTPSEGRGSACVPHNGGWLSGRKRTCLQDAPLHG